MGARRHRRAARALLALVALLAAGAGGLALGRSAERVVVQVREQPAPVARESRAPLPPTPERVATRAVALLADPAALAAAGGPGPLSSRLATPAFAPRLKRRLEAGHARLAAGLGASRAGALLRVVPLGVRRLAAVRGRVRVAVWQVAFLAVPGTRAALAAWSVSRLDLERTRAGWRLAGIAADTPGPAPGITLPVQPTPPARFAALARPFGSVPW